MKRKARTSGPRRTKARPRPSARRIGPLRLPATLDIQQVRELATLVRKHLDTTPQLQIEGSAVTSADTAGLQLLVALRIEALARGILLQWQDPSPALRQVAAILGLRAALGLEPEAA